MHAHNTSFIGDSSLCPLRGLASDGEQDVRGAHDGGEALERIVGHAHRELALAGFVQRAGDLRAQLLRAHGVELDRRHGEAAAAEGHGGRAGLAELDARALQVDEVPQRLGQLAEAVVELLAQELEVGDVDGAGDPPVHVDFACS